MVLATLLVLSSPTNSVSMQAVTVKSGRGSNCNVPIDYSFARITSHFGVRDNPFGARPKRLEVQVLSHVKDSCKARR